MKSSNKSSILTGTVLLLIAALFSFSLILQPLDFGVTGPGHDNFLYVLGNIMFTVYGFCSILIPLFLFIAGISCFATKWTSQKTMRLLTALIPFYTSVLTEKICRTIIDLGPNNSTTIKIIITVVTGLMLVIIEILGAGVIAESVNQRLFYKNGKSRVKIIEEEIPVSESKNKAFEYNPIKSSAFDKALSEISNPVETVTVAKPVEIPQTSVAVVTPEPVVNPEAVAVVEAVSPSTDVIDEDINSVADLDEEEKQALVELKAKSLNGEDIFPESEVSEKTAVEISEEPAETKDESFESLMKDAEDLYEEDIPSIEDYETVDSIKQEETTISKENSENSEKEEAEPANPASIITQEEYAALINPDVYAEEAEPEELEWPDLPPVPETLPPEYIDENDPALNFPPEEEFEQSLPEIDLTSELPPESEKENKAEEAETPYSAGKYVDSVVHPNPAYPFGITIHNQEEASPKKVETAVKQPAYTAPKYPTKISLSESSNIVEPASMTYSSTPAEESQDDYVENDYVEDVTLPEPDYFNMNEPSLGEAFTSDLEDYFDDEPEEQYSAERTLSEDFFDIDMNNQPEEEFEETETMVSSTQIQTPTETPVQPSNQASEKPYFSSTISNVFSEMEADIRKKYGIVDEPEEEEVNSQAEDDATIETPVQVGVQTIYNDEEIIEEAEPEVEETGIYEDSELTAQEDEISEDEENENPSPELNPNANSANNLTADELTDFFNAQQAENTPVTKEIQGNPTQIGNRATKKGPYVIPSDLLTAYKDDQYWIIDDQTKQASLNLKQTLSEFGIEADIIGIKKGPVVTMFEILPAPGVKLSKIVALQDNIALSLAAQSVRIVAPIPGKQAVGIEVPNKHRSVVGFREIIEMDLPEWDKMAVPVILGKDILGKAQLIDLTKTPHMLIAGATGSGKSVCVNSLILSILYKRSYKDVKLILVDPKVVELKLYNNIPHLLSPVITEPKKALAALQYCLCEMERRYSLLDGLGVRDISSYNQRIKERQICTEKLPYIVVIIDEFADLMATSGKELETTVARLTAMSRAVGIHLVLATQRPSVNVITGLIKANIPSRIAFMVASRTDSNIIIDSVGAEKLLGRGDMLYASAVDPAPNRIQGTFVSDQEVENVVNAVKEYGEPDYVDEEIMFGSNDEDDGGNVDLFGNDIGEDPLYDQALDIVVQAGKASASYIQRRLKIGYNRAARLVEEMEERGIVGPANGSKPREIIHIP